MKLTVSLILAAAALTGCLLPQTGPGEGMISPSTTHRRLHELVGDAMELGAATAIRQMDQEFLARGDEPLGSDRAVAGALMSLEQLVPEGYLESPKPGWTLTTSPRAFAYLMSAETAARVCKDIPMGDAHRITSQPAPQDGAMFLVVDVH